MPLPQIPFLLVRHGETEMNAKQLCCGGGVDTVLTATGKAQATTAGETLALLPAAEKPTLVIHSDMSRSRETATIINRHLNLPMIGNNDLREHMMGVLEGKPWAEATPYFATDTVIEGGESRSQYAERVRKTLAKVMADYAGERLLIVAHGGTFHSLLHVFNSYKTNVLIPNATPHHWQPEPQHAQMPWRVSLFKNNNGVLARQKAPICPSAQKIL